MPAKVKFVLSVAGEAIETAAGYALIAVGIYAALFLDLTGSGSLWNTMRHVKATSQEGLESPNATRVIKVATQPIVAKAHEDRILSVFDEASAEGSVTALYQAPEATGLRPSAAFTDTPADPNSGKIWKRGIQGELRNFTVYGKSDQTTSATMFGGGSPARSEAAVSRTPVSAEGSPARAETSAAARPGMGLRLSRGTLSASDTSRNIR